MKNHKRKMLTVLFGTLLSSFASAISLSTDGTGQVLLFPYYTANAGQSTTFAITNHTAVGKALRVRVNEGRNGRDVLWFNLYLGAFDSWSAGLFAFGDTTNQAANLITLDHSCTFPNIRTTSTLPRLPNNVRYVPLTNFSYTAQDNDSEINTLDRTREGFIEVIEMGSVDPQNATGRYLTSVKGSPSNCAAIERSWVIDSRDSRILNYGDASAGTSVNDVSAPTGGLSGTGSIISVADGSYINYDAVALNNFRRQPLHSSNDDGHPWLSDADPVSDVLTERGVVRATWLDQAIGTSGSQGGRIDAVSSVLASAATINEFNFDNAQLAKTEWIVTLPTRGFYSDSGRNKQTAAIAPFARPLNQFSASDQLVEGPPANCEAVSLRRYDRQGMLYSDSTPLALPIGAIKRELCYVVNSFSWPNLGSDGYSTVFHSRLTRNTGGLPIYLDPELGEITPYGHVVMDWRTYGNSLPTSVPLPTPRRARPSLEGHQFVGLPVIGFFALSIENRNARGAFNDIYSGAFDHKRMRDCVNESRSKCESN